MSYSFCHHFKKKTYFFFFFFFFFENFLSKLKKKKKKGGGKSRDIFRVLIFEMENDSFQYYFTVEIQSGVV